MNVRGLLPNINFLSNDCFWSQASIIAFQETWLSPDQIVNVFSDYNLEGLIGRSKILLALLILIRVELFASCTGVSSIQE